MKKGFRFSGSWECPVCGKKLRSHQAVHGHIMFAHGADALEKWRASEESSSDESESSAEPTTPVNPTPSVKALKLEVEALELQEKLAALKAKQADRARIPDMAEQAGLGPMQPAVKDAVQARVFNTDSQPPQQKTDWLSILSSPNVPLLLNFIRGVLRVEGGDGVGTVLKDLGFSLKDLIVNSMASKAGSLKIAGLDLTGASITPDLLVAILQFRASEEKAKAEVESKNKMAEALEHLVTTITPMLAEKFGGAIAARALATSEPEKELLKCSKCDELVDVTGLHPGGTVTCKCGTIYRSEDDTPPKMPKAPPRINKPVESQSEFIRCEKCQQSLDVTSLSVGAEVKCPSCGEVGKLVSPDEPLRPLPAEAKPESLYERNRL